MYTVTLLTVGKIKGSSGYLEPGIAEFQKRLKPHVRLTIIETTEEPETATVTREQVMDREAGRLLGHIKPQNRVIALSERGEKATSEQLSLRLFGPSRGTYGGGSNPPNGGTAPLAEAPIIVIVGGPVGLSPRVLERSDWVLSLSPMTFPHQMVRLIFLEQLYRALKIFRNEPYHK